MAHHPCLLVPCYNHGAQIGATVAALAPLGLPCLIVDDGSEPATAAVLEQLAAAHSFVTLLRLSANRGKGAAVLHGIKAAAGLGFSHALQIDADGQHDIDDVPRLLALSRAEPAALVSGWPRYGADIPASRRYGRTITHFWVWVETLSFEIKDSMCGFRVYPVAATHALAQRRRIGRRMDFDTDVMVRLYWAGTPVRFLATAVRYPPDGVSHFALWRDNLRISWLHTRLVGGMLLRVPRLLRRRQRHWSEQEERGVYWGMRASLQCYRLFGRRALQALLYLIIGYFFLANRGARAASRQFLERVHAAGGELERAPDRRLVFCHLYSFGLSLVDRLGSWAGDIRRADVLFPARHLLHEQSRSGRGAVILTAHLGNPEMCRALIDQATDLKLNVLVFSRHAHQINRLMREVNPRADVELIQIDAIGPHTALLLEQKIEAGEFVVIAADRTSPNAPQRSSRAAFLGGEAAFPQGPYILASLLRCPVFLLFCLRRGDRYHIELEPFADRIELPRRQRQVLLEQCSQRFAARLEHHARRAPLQWFNFFDFWRQPPAASDAAGAVAQGLSARTYD
jgi:predicted LPLAT superfamily acyltransferase